MSQAYETGRAAQRIGQRGALKTWHNQALALIERNNLLSSPDRTVVELGSSACEMIEHLKKEFGCRCIAGDYPQNAIDFARSLGFEAFRYNGNEPDSLSAEYNGIADAIVSAATFEHITNLNAALSIVRRLLKPSGYFVLTVPNSTSYKNWLHFVYRGIPRDEGHHYRFFAWTNTVRTLILNGFSLIDQEHEVDLRWPVRVLDLSVNLLRRITEPLARRITTIEMLAEQVDSHSHLTTLHWAFLLRKDPLFSVTENPYAVDQDITREKSVHTIERIRRELLEKNLITAAKFKVLSDKLSAAI